MKTLKNVAAAIASVFAVCAMSVPFAASAVYDPCDVNHDYSVDMVDYNLVNKYVNGITHISNFYRLDVDHNLIIDKADVQRVWKKIFSGGNYSSNFISRTYSGGAVNEQNVAFQWTEGTDIASENNSSFSRQYKKYTYSTQSTSSYSLTPPTPSTLNNVGDSPDGIIDGNDDYYATTLLENSGIVRLEIPNGNSTDYRTGFIVGSHLIATAAANIYKNGSFYNNITIRSCSNTGYPSSELHEIAAHIPQGYVNRYVSPELDYALITVTEDLSSYPRFAIGTTYNLSTENFEYMPIHLTGFSADNSDVRLCSANGHLIDLNPSYVSMIAYNTYSDEDDGDGAPVYTIIKDSNGDYFYTALSINAGSRSYVSGGGSSGHYDYNRGVLFTKYHRQFFLNNSNAQSDYSGLTS